MKLLWLGYLIYCLGNFAIKLCIETGLSSRSSIVVVVALVVGLVFLVVVVVIVVVVVVGGSSSQKSICIDFLFYFRFKLVQFKRYLKKYNKKDKKL